MQPCLTPDGFALAVMPRDGAITFRDIAGKLALLPSSATSAVGSAVTTSTDLSSATVSTRSCSTGSRKAYDSTELREELDEHGTKSVIPNRSNRKQPFSFSKRLYKLRWRIEAAFNRLKDFRRIATRYDKLARNYLASVCLAASSRLRHWSLP